MLHRLEWLIALGVSVGLALTHLGDIRWPVFVSFFLVIDVIGYLPGAVAFRRSPTGHISRGYYVAYNVMHSLVTNAVLVGLWMLVIGPEWALLAVPIHLFGDRALFGNTLKPFGVPFEPHPHPAFVSFEKAYAGADDKAGEGALAETPAAATVDTGRPTDDAPTSTKAPDAVHT
jgi:hypothetical protein